MHIKDYYNSFVDLSLQQCLKTDYVDKQKVKKHNAACYKLKKLKDEMEQHPSEDVLYALLNHEDDRVKVNAASLCLQLQILVEQTVLTLKRIIDISDDSTIRFTAKMLLQKYKYD